MFNSNSKIFVVDVIVGARPNFVKAAPLCAILDKEPRLNVRLIHTGQHNSPELFDAMFAELSLRKPDVALAAGGGTQAEQTGRTMRALEQHWANSPCHAVIVIGDVNSTLAASLTAKKAGLPVVHLESGLRSGDMLMPEEINRRVVDCISDRLWASTRSGYENLIAEGRHVSDIVLIGNVMVDAMRSHQVTDSSDDALKFLPQSHHKPDIVCTLHRPINVDDAERCKVILTSLRDLAKRFKTIVVTHPRLQNQMLNIETDPIIMIPPLGYRAFNTLLSQSRLVITDSGGIQEETSVLGIPCLTVRPSTERPETLRSGTNVLVEPDQILHLAEKMLSVSPRADRQSAVIEGWDGHASERAAVDLVAWLKAGCPTQLGHHT